jgi:hypothetical protein
VIEKIQSLPLAAGKRDFDGAQEHALVAGAETDLLEAALPAVDAEDDALLAAVHELRIDNLGFIELLAGLGRGRTQCGRNERNCQSQMTHHGVPPRVLGCRRLIAPLKDEDA